MKFGAHVSVSGGVFNAPQNGKDVTCEVVQIFTKNQQQWRVKTLTDEEVEKFIAEEKRTGVKAVCVHASYLINLGGFDKQKVFLSRQNFMVEMERAEALGIPYLVIHPGSHLDEGEQKGIDRISESLNFVFDKCPDFKLKILLETTAGQGTNLGYTFEQLAEMKSKVDAQDRIGVCVDTCHIFAAGYELRTAEAYEKSIAELDKIIGCDQVSVIHVNDSKKEFGSRRDRHENIGDGEIGLEAFRFLVNDTRFKNAAMILETPKGPKNDMDIENLNRLRGLVENS